MFRNLKFKLTLTNVLVVAIIFSFVFSGVYVFMQRGISTQTMQIMRFIAADAGSVPPPNAHRGPEKRFQRIFYSYFFYVKVSQGGKIFETSPTPPFNKTDLAQLVNAAESQDLRLHRLKWKKNNYTILKAPLADQNGAVYVFASTNPENVLLKILLSTLALMGVIGLALALFGSLFMAEKALLPIKEAWQKQKNFVADASHELRTPLAVMQTNLELVMDNKDETVESQTKWLQNILEENKRLSKLVDDLLTLARADSDQKVLNITTFSLNSAILSALAPFEPVVKEKNIELNLSLDKEINFNGDVTRIKQLMVILVDNAIKYTAAGGIVSVVLQQLGKNIELTVSDTGEGIEPEHLDKIFQRFYRVDKARSTQSGGTGLGLAIADWIVKEHNGTIKATSEKGNGTTFYVNLPINNF